MNSFHQILVGAAATLPDHTAIVHAEEAWSYSQLHDCSEQFYQCLVAAGIKSGGRIVLRSTNRPEAIALAAACAQLNVTFIPLDIDAPLARTQSLLEQIQPQLVVSDSQAPSITHTYPRATLNTKELLVLDQVLESDSIFGADIPLYIIFTSGSTGQPKGIMMSESAVCSFFGGLCRFMALPAGTRYATTSPLHFDYFWLDVGLTLASAGTLVLLPRALLRQPRRLIDEMGRTCVEYVSAVPSIWKLILRLSPNSLAELKEFRHIVFAGEHFPQVHIRKLYELIPQLKITNIYGQSESIACAFYQLPNPLPKHIDHLPVGRGHDRSELFLLDDQGKTITQPFQQGMLHLSGPILFSGYFQKPQETQKRLIPDPRSQKTGTVFCTGDICYIDEDGVFYFVGRADSQVQIFGNRVELEEIEAVLAKHPWVNNVCIVSQSNENQLALYAFIVPSSEEFTGLDEQLRHYCADHLPSYMRPKYYRIMEKIPQNSNGKNDAAQLKALLNE